MRNILSSFLLLLIMKGVFGETVLVSVMEGDSVTLHTGATEIQNVKVIDWRFGDVRVAQINRPAKIIETRDDELGGKFKGRLKLVDQTGDLTITDISTKDTGGYKVTITSITKTSISFNLTAATDPRSDGVTIVSVTEGDSVVLHTGVPEIQEDDEILWRFRDKDVIAKIKKDEYIFSTYDYSAGGIFRSRLQLNYQTGNIVISDIRNSTAGLYEVDFKKNSYTTHKSFNVTIRDKLNTVSVKEGVSLILESGLPKLERDDLVQWRFNHEDHVMAKVNKTAQLPSLFDGADGSFRGRLELDDQTGSLTIKNITAEHAGLYHLDITSSRHTIFKRFIVSVCAVSGSDLSPGWWWWMVGCVGSGIVGVLLVAGVSYCHKKCERRRRLLRYAHGRNLPVLPPEEDQAPPSL